MQYPSYGRTAESRLRLSALSGGIDRVSDDAAIDANRLRDACNLWWKDGALRTRPGVRPTDDQFPNFGTVVRQVVLPESIVYNGQRGQLILLLYTLISGYALGAVFCEASGRFSIVRQNTSADWTTLPTQLLPISGGDGLAMMYIDGVPYSLDYDGTLTQLDIYVPTVLIAARGAETYEMAKAMTVAAGTVYEPYNRLTEAFKMEFFPTDGLPYHTLPSFTRHRPARLVVTLRGATDFNIPLVSDTGDGLVSTDPISGYVVCWSPQTGVVWFQDSSTKVAVPDTEKWSSLIFTYRPLTDQPADRELIRSMTVATWFGGSTAGLGGGTRCFLAGSHQEPSRLCYSAIDNIAYLPENNDTRVGQAGQAITALKKQADMLVIFKETEVWYSSYTVGVTDSEALTAALENGTVTDIETAVAQFPLALIAWNVGCDLPDTLALCDNRLVWTNSDGRVYMLVSGNIYSERNVREIGQAVWPLLQQSQGAIRCAADCYGHYLLMAGTQIFLFDYRTAGLAAVGTGTADSTLQSRLAWYRWELPSGVRATAIVDGETPLLIGEKQLWILGGEVDTVDGESPIHSMLQLPHLTAGREDRRKTVRTVTLESGSPYAPLTLLPSGDRPAGDGDKRTVTTDENGFARAFLALRRVRRFSLRAETDRSVAWRGITFSIQ
ncbi:MAG: hypothetical protein IK954_04280 [Clostridia bacterium]|nr:hypothetical protein [Clostridia bacterium]